MDQIEWYKNFLPNYEKKLEILHFNDVYNIEDRKRTNNNSNYIVAGIARFKKAFDLYKSKEKLVLFSGDFFSPSTMGSLFEG